MTLQDNKTKHRQGDSVLRPHIPGWGDEQRRTHRIRQRIRHAPWWLWLLATLFLLGVGYLMGGLRPDGRSSVLAEQLQVEQSRVAVLNADKTHLQSQLDQSVPETELAQVQQQLEQVQAQLNESVPLADLESIQTQLDAADAELTELKPQLSQANVWIEQLETELIPSLRSQLQSQTTRANQLQSTLTAEQAAIPIAVAAVLRTNAVAVEAEHFVGVQWNIERRWLGDSNDEAHVFRNGHGKAVYRSLAAPVTTYWDNEVLVIGLGMPSLSDAYFELKATDLQPNSGFLEDLIHFFGRDTNLQPLLAEADRVLHEKACTDLPSLKLFIQKAEATATGAARGYEVSLRWRDKSGLYHTVLTDQMLLQSAC